MTDVRRFADPAALAEGAADELLTIGRAAIAAHGRFTLALSGGSTPRALNERLVARAEELDWERVHLFWGDERCVPPDHPDSNYRMARETLLERVPVPPENVHRMAGEVEPTAAAADYERELRAVLGERPRLDLILLGMGDDGHTASLFPGTAAVRESERWVLGYHVPALEAWRLTLTPVVLNAAAAVLFLVAGAGKAARLREVIAGPYQPDRLPAQVVRPTDGQLRWLVDEAAAGELD